MGWGSYGRKEGGQVRWGRGEVWGKGKGLSGEGGGMRGGRGSSGEGEEGDVRGRGGSNRVSYSLIILMIICFIDCSS